MIARRDLTIFQTHIKIIYNSKTLIWDRADIISKLGFNSNMQYFGSDITDSSALVQETERFLNKSPLTDQNIYLESTLTILLEDVPVYLQRLNVYNSVYFLYGEG